MNMEKNRGAPDFLLLFLTLVLVGFGIIMVFSSSSVLAYHNFGDNLYFVKRQTMWAVIGFIAMLIAMNIPYRFYRKFFFLFGFVSLILLILVYIPGIGIERNGARSWIGAGSFSLQPAEFAKLGLILYISALISRKGELFRTFWSGLFPVITVVLLFFSLIAAQPDLGGALIILMTAALIIFCGGANLKQLFNLFLLASPFIFILAWKAQYRRDRLLTFLDPWNDGMNGLGDGYQLIHSYYAMAHGGITGAGFGKSIEKYLYLPYPQTDFIFSIMAEEFGFIGIVLFLLVFLLLLWRGLYVCLRCHDLFAKLVGIGFIGEIAIQAFINIGGVTGTIPITGVTLPFISYGGSSLLVSMIGTGILLSISRESNK